jgi:hypothetical protein
MSSDTSPSAIAARRRVLLLQLEALRSRAGHQHIDRARALRAELRRLAGPRRSS